MNIDRDDASRESNTHGVAPSSPATMPLAAAETSPARAAVARSIGIIGAGPVGIALGVAFSRAGWPVVAVSSRDAARRARFAEFVPGAALVADPQAVADAADLVILAVPDDAIAGVAAGLRLGPGRVIVHTSGALGAEVLRAPGGVPASAAPAPAGAASPAPALPPAATPDPAPSPDARVIGAFHPLVSFTSDVEGSVAALRGATVALDGDDAALDVMSALATAVGASPLRLPSGAKSIYHAAAVMASGGLIALLDAIATLGAAAGMDEGASMAVYGRLVEQTLANAKAAGIGAALTGPITRGDAGTVRAHLDALRLAAPDVLEIYLAAARRELRIAEERGVLAPVQVSRVADVLAKTG